MARKWAVIRHAAPTVILGAAAVAVVAMLFGMDPGPAAAVAGLAVSTVSLLNALRSWRRSVFSTGVKVLHIAQATTMSAFAAATYLTVAVDERWLPVMLTTALTGATIMLADLILLRRQVTAAQARFAVLLAEMEADKRRSSAALLDAAKRAAAALVDKTGHDDPAP